MNNNIFTFTTPFVSPRRPIPSSLGGYRDSRDATTANELGLFYTSENGIRRLRGLCCVLSRCARCADFRARRVSTASARWVRAHGSTPRARRGARGMKKSV